MLSLFGNTKQRAIEEFIKFNNAIENKFSDFEFEFEKKISDEDAIEHIKRTLNIDVCQMNNFSIKVRNEYILEILKNKEISVRQLSELLNIREVTIYKIISRYNKEKNKGC